VAADSFTLRGAGPATEASRSFPPHSARRETSMSSPRTEAPQRSREPLGNVLRQHLDDLEAARQVQQKLFPPELPGVPGWAFAGVCRAARSVSGDYSALFARGGGLVSVAVGEVAGRGLGPALVVAGLHAWVRSQLPRRRGHLAGLMEALNRHLLSTT